MNHFLVGFICYDFAHRIQFQFQAVEPKWRRQNILIPNNIYCCPFIKCFLTIFIFVFPCFACHSSFTKTFLSFIRYFLAFFFYHTITFFLFWMVFTSHFQSPVDASSSNLFSIRFLFYIVCVLFRVFGPYFWLLSMQKLKRLDFGAQSVVQCFITVS